MIPERKKSIDKTKFRITGVILIILSFILYGGLFIVPFTPFTFGTKAAISSILIVSGEISFWVGGFILGKELVMKYRRYMNPLRWFKKKKE
ncbi:MAG: transporter suffix domain-containing protein [Peptococcaceae bacterium]|nr:transporter suffix domain-containing protein [Peptococcaceae bacterium]